MTIRPHVRFDGRTLSEIGDQRWAHAQNDALGYFLWLSSTLAASGALTPDANAVSVLTPYFNRSLAQITDDWRCTEAYYLREGRAAGVCVPPLLLSSPRSAVWWVRRRRPRRYTQ